MVEGMLVGSKEELNGIEKEIHGEIVGDFSVRRGESYLCDSSSIFEPKTRTYREIERQERQKGAHIGLITSSGYLADSNMYYATGVFYKLD